MDYRKCEISQSMHMQVKHANRMVTACMSKFNLKKNRLISQMEEEKVIIVTNFK